jgi:hypothetical protein
MTTVTRTVAFAFVASLCLMGGMGGAQAEDAFYIGKWKITGAAVGPWVPSDDMPDPAESKTLVGREITLSAGAVDGPGSFPCKGPKYEVIEGGPEMLFQGLFGEMHENDQSADPQKLAQQAGFTGTKYRTVITGCEYEVDFSFGADDDTAAFALNNFIYTMKRE